MKRYTPQTKLLKRREQVIDARICEISGCPFFRKRQIEDGTYLAGCDAGIYQAELPMGPLMQEIERNGDAVPGMKADTNPFLLRLLMSPECVRPECGIANIDYKERIVPPAPEESAEELFPHEKNSE